MFSSREARIALLLALLAATGYFATSYAPLVISAYREAYEIGPVWAWAYLLLVAGTCTTFLALIFWVFSRLWSNTRDRDRLRHEQSRNPSQMSRVEQQAEITTHLSAGRALTDDTTLSEAARGQIRESMAAIEAKRDQQTLEIVAFGTVSSGKSSLLNTLAGRDAFATDIKGGTTLNRSEVPWPDGDKVVLVDTPGLAEIEATQRQDLAKASARDADVVLFVTDGPLRDFEFEFLEQLAAMEKRIVVCLNKEDWYRPEDRDLLLKQLAAQVSQFVPRENVVAIRASATTRVRTRVLPDGSQTDEGVSVEADIRPLAERLTKIVTKDGQDLLLANLLLQARGMAADAKALVQSQLDDKANEVVERAMWQAGAAAALSPVPVLDLLAGAGITTNMVLELARIYRQKIDLDTISRLLAELGKQLVSVAGANIAAPLAASGIASLLKTVPGAGTLSGGILQGLVQVLVTRWIGKVFITYFKGEMQTPTLGWASLARKQWDEVTRPQELVKLVHGGLAKLRGRE